MFDALTAIGSVASAGIQIGTGVAARNAAEKQADRARGLGKRAAAQERKEGRRLAGKQVAAASSQGREVGSGSVLDILAQTAADAEDRAALILAELEQEAEDFETRGKVALTSGIFGAATTLLGSSEAFEELFSSPSPSKKRFFTTSASRTAAKKVSTFS